MTIVNKINEIRKNRGGVAVALIDPDAKYENKLPTMIDIINKSDFDYIFIGGSIICDNEFDRRLAFIKKSTDLPLIIFPGSSDQISIHADGILFLSLISGRNPQYLIGEHIKSAPIIYNMSIEPIPIAYILLEGGIRSSVEIISDTKPIPMDKHEIILAHALAGQYLGKAFIFLETGRNFMSSYLHISEYFLLKFSLSMCIKYISSIIFYRLNNMRLLTSSNS